MMHGQAVVVRRRGVVLLVVISLLMLFAVAGIAFVIYSEAQATTARVWRESESVRRPDMDPELLFNYFLGQMIYDTDNPLSALRAQSLARNMYGPRGGMTPFAGTGRVHTNPNPAVDDYYQMDYTNYGALRDPDARGSPNVSYTYPDFDSFPFRLSPHMPPPKRGLVRRPCRRRGFAFAVRACPDWCWAQG